MAETRSELIDAFISQTAWSGGARYPLPSDASKRRYERIVRTDGASAILMDAEPALGEDIQPFLKIGAFLSAHGLSAPAVYARCSESGFLLLEDLGKDLFARLLERRPNLEPALYRAATDVLVKLHRLSPPDLICYDAPAMCDKALLAWEWYAAALHPNSAPDPSAFTRAFSDVLGSLAPAGAVLILRDYHAENLLWLPEREACARVGLLDFQDASLGHPAYDLVSLLQDARRDVSAELEAEICAYYCAETGQDPQEFARDYAILGVQRNLRILGVFVRLCLRDARPRYLDLIPRVWGYLQRALKHPALAEIGPLIDAQLPSPDHRTLTEIEARCPISHHP